MHKHMGRESLPLHLEIISFLKVKSIGAHTLAVFGYDSRCGLSVYWPYNSEGESRDCVTLHSKNVVGRVGPQWIEERLETEKDGKSLCYCDLLKRKASHWKQYLWDMSRPSSSSVTGPRGACRAQSIVFNLTIWPNTNEQIYPIRDGQWDGLFEKHSYWRKVRNREPLG